MLRLQGAVPAAPPVLRPALPAPAATRTTPGASPPSDLRGRVALVTGARVKIGYQAAILLLRAGCRVVSLTRFPRDAAARYAREPDFAAWRDRLSIYGCDLRHTPSVEQLCHHLEADAAAPRFPDPQRLPDRAAAAGLLCPPVEAEQAAIGTCPPRSGRSSPTTRPAAGGARGAAPGVAAAGGPPLGGPGTGPPGPPARRTGLHPPGPALATSWTLFPRGVLDQDLQQVDLRAHNSWRLALHEVPTLELLEVLLVNATAPFVMTARLKGLMLRVRGAPTGTATSGDPANHLVMVSAMEGQFYREHKTDRHPHTNMAKAALNMLVRTSAADLAKRRHPPQRGGHGLGDGRGPGPPGGPQGGGARVLAAARRGGRGGAGAGAPPGRFPDRAATRRASSSRTTGRRPGNPSARPRERARARTREMDGRAYARRPDDLAASVSAHMA